MYDKLGELLRDALEKGSIPQDASCKEESSPSAETGEGVVSFAQEGSSPPPPHNDKIAREAVFKVLHEKEVKRGVLLHGGGEGREGGAVKYNAPSLMPLSREEIEAYSILGVERGANREEIKRAWREKLKMFHPDENSTNEVVQKVARQKTVEVMAAYRLLCSKIEGLEH